MLILVLEHLIALFVKLILLDMRDLVVVLLRLALSDHISNSIDRLVLNLVDGRRVGNLPMIYFHLWYFRSYTNFLRCIVNTLDRICIQALSCPKHLAILRHVTLNSHLQTTKVYIT